LPKSEIGNEFLAGETGLETSHFKGAGACRCLWLPVGTPRAAPSLARKIPAERLRSHAQVVETTRNDRRTIKAR
jgi:hypothetical protein